MDGSGILNGFVQLFQPMYILNAFLGALIGTLIGVLPGLGPVATMSMLLPLTIGGDPTGGLILLFGIWYGAQYGGSTTSILVNVPGEAVSVMTCIDGHQMAKKGRAGAALSAAAIGSWVAGSIGIVGLQFFAPLLARSALAFGPPEYFALALLGLILLSNVSGRSVLKNMVMVFFGVALTTVGLDPMTGGLRYTFGLVELAQGFDYVPILIGMYGMAEIIEVTVNLHRQEKVNFSKIRFRDLYPNRQEIRRIWAPTFRGGVVGFFTGLLPGPSPVIATYASYALEKRVSRYRHEMGSGAIEGVAGPESANNAATAGAMIPLVSLGFPFSAPTALLLAGLALHGIYPGPLFISEHPDMFWILIASMYVGNIILLVLNLPLVGVFASLLRIPPGVLMSLIAVLAIVGTYSLNNSFFDVWAMLVAGILGYVLRNSGYDPAPLILGMVLGPMIMTSFHQSLMIFNGNALNFWMRPISGVMMTLSVVITLVFPLVRKTLAAKRDRLAVGTEGPGLS